MFSKVFLVILGLWCIATLINLRNVYNMKTELEQYPEMMLLYIHDSLSHEISKASELLIEAKDWTVSHKIDDKIDKQLETWYYYMIPYDDLPEHEKDRRKAEIKKILNAD